MLLYKSIVQPLSVYSAFIIFLQKGQSRNRKGRKHSSFFMRRELTEQSFQLEKTTTVQNGIQVNRNNSSLFLLKQNYGAAGLK